MTETSRLYKPKQEALGLQLQTIGNSPDKPYRSSIRDQLLDWTRVALLKKTLVDKGITDRKKISEFLPTLNLDDLRQIHFLSIPTKAFYAHKGIGCVGIEIFKSPTTEILADRDNLDYDIFLTKTDKILNLHFAPLGDFVKSEKHFSEAMLLGALDLIRTIDWFRENYEIPKVVEGFTTLPQAKFSIKILGFHATDEGHIVFPKGKQPLKPAEIETVLSKSSKVPEDLTNEIWLRIFIRGEDFFSKETKDKAQKITNLFYHRMSAGNEDIDSVEKRARIIAITACLENQLPLLKTVLNHFR